MQLYIIENWLWAWNVNDREKIDTRCSYVSRHSRDRDYKSGLLTSDGHWVGFSLRSRTEKRIVNRSRPWAQGRPRGNASAPAACRRQWRRCVCVCVSYGYPAILPVQAEPLVGAECSVAVCRCRCWACCCCCFELSYRVLLRVFAARRRETNG